jgi:hypothetical protein
MANKLVDQATGEVAGAEAHVYETTELALRVQPDFSKARPLEAVVGKRPPLFNLRDHPEFDGKAFTIVRVREAEGDFGYHLYIAGWMSQSDKAGDKAQAMVLRTGSEFVLGRVVPAIATINSGQALTGVLHMAGAAWLMD